MAGAPGTDHGDRRTMLAGLGAACGLCLASPAGARPGSAPGRIDVHHHFESPALIQFNRRFAPAPPYSTRWSAAEDLADMDRFGTALAVLSSLIPTSGGSVDDRRTLARASNDFGARLVADHPHRFALFAALPHGDVEGSMRELAYGFDTLKAVGIAIYSDSGDKWLSDPIFAPLLEELDRRRAIVFVHPHAANCCTNLVPSVPESMVEYAAATSRAIANLIFSGTSRRYPDIRYVFAHGGGAMPFIVERFLGRTQAEIVPGILTRGQQALGVQQPPGTALAELRRFHYDTAQIANPVSLRALRQVVPVSQIMFGTDYWYRTAEDSARGLVTSRVFSKRELRAIDRDNALRLMPLLAQA